MKKIFTFTLMSLMAWGIGWSLGVYFPSQNQQNYTQTTNTSNKVREGLISSNNSSISQAQQTKLISTNQPITKENSKSLSKVMAANELLTVTAPSQLSSMVQIDPRVNDVVSLPQKFASESINYEWALAREKTLKEVFYKDPAFQSRQILGIACKSSLCEIKIAASDAKELNAIGSDIMRLISQVNTGGFEQNMMITYSKPDESGSFYIKSVNN
jgi:hypothetical protein